MREALKEAAKASEKDEVPVGAVVVYEGKIIARGHNLRENKQSILGHAELVALSKASRKLSSWRLPGCDVYVTLEPCPMCAGALQQARVRHVYYGVTDPKAGAVTLGLNLHENKQLNHRYKMECLGVAECGAVLSRFFKSKRTGK
ncbi:MAG: nucleoside deaminase [Deltaproteobacteria bacterium]|nr:nucleoside deaminase [Deltaproteobacteria bacterium]